MVFLKSILLLLLHHLASKSCNAAQGHHNPPRKSLQNDKSALLAFKKAVLIDPNSSLSNWNESVDVCDFYGVLCNKKHHRVIGLSLNNLGLVGRLTPSISNLTGLKNITLFSNHFFGTIPPGISSLRHLQYLRLDGNNFHGSAPNFLFSLPDLGVAYFFENKLNSTLQPSLFSNCTKLLDVDFSHNMLTGKIPKEVGNCRQLWSLNLYNNRFTGELPISLINTSLESIDVEYNHLSGELPSKLVENLPFLYYLHLSYTDMVSNDGNTNLDPFLTSLRNCSYLLDLELAGMNLGGRLPASIGKLGRHLENLLLQENRLSGSIPRELANLSNLIVLNLTSNLFSGTIPSEVIQFTKLDQLFLSYNLFSSPFPEELCRISHLGLLDLSHNQFHGEIPESIGDLINLTHLFMNNNLLTGKIPPAIGKCTDLHMLDLSFNKLNGRIPPEIIGLEEIRIFINLSHNYLEGNLPTELSKLEKVLEMDLSSNNLTGTVFPQISSCIAIRMINFSNNFLHGHLPDSLGELKNLESFDVSKNRFSGIIPATLNQITTLTYLNVSFNNFNGMIPVGGFFNSSTNLSFLGNPRLCGAIPGIPVCSSKNQTNTSLIILIFIIFISVFLTTICCVLAFHRLKDMITSQKIEAGQKTKTPEFVHNFPRLTYRELSEATSGFDEQRLIGSGSYGRVYRGLLSDGSAIAVKVLNVQSGNSTKSFSRECQALKRIRHRNLIRIITACSLPDFKALVLPYMANGSLDSRLYQHSRTGLASGSSDLNLIQRVNICSDIAEGMAYLHHHSPVRVIHCDLKPSNVLLNDEMTALVSDFGISRLIMTVGIGNVAGVQNTGNSSANVLCGSIGYIAPEYGFGSNPSMKGDVYSFGILVLEMVTRKRPTDEFFAGALNLHKWAKTHYHGRIEKIVDSSLSRALRDQSPEVRKMWEVAIGELIELGILCTQETPSTRPSMLDAADDLDRLKRYVNGDTTATFASSLGISSSTLGGDNSQNF